MNQTIKIVPAPTNKAQNFYDMNPNTLRGLLNDRHVSLSWTMKGYSRTIAIPDPISRGALVVFSGYARRKLMTEEPTAQTLLVHGGVPSALRRVLAWITECCQEGQIIQFEKTQEMGFMVTWQVYKMAIVLEIPMLQAQALHRVTAICRDQVRAMDCREVFISTDSDKIKFQDMVAERTAKAIFEGRLREKADIAMFRSEGPVFNNAVSKYLEPLVSARNKAWRMGETVQIHAEMKTKRPEVRKNACNVDRKEVPTVSQDWTVIKAEESEEDWVVVDS